VATAAGNAVLDFIEAEKLFERVAPAGEALRAALAPLAAHPNVGEIRGLGLLIGVEFVKNKETREPFPRSENVAEKIRQAALEKNVLTYPTQGCVDGVNGDHLLLAPPFVIRPNESAMIAAAVQHAVSQVFGG